MINKQLQYATITIFEQIEAIVTQFKEDDYSKKLTILNSATVGQHFRHILEFFSCLVEGSINGTVCYDERKRDLNLEHNKEKVLLTIKNILSYIENANTEEQFFLKVSYDMSNNDRGDIITVRTNFERELIYNLEHAIHHMAIIRIGIQQTFSYIKLNEQFGIAASTLRFKEELHKD